jgi:hypothetical protein
LSEKKTTEAGTQLALEKKKGWSQVTRSTWRGAWKQCFIRWVCFYTTMMKLKVSCITFHYVHPFCSPTTCQQQQSHGYNELWNQNTESTNILNTFTK